jgi:hypothetical protein
MVPTLVFFWGGGGLKIALPEVVFGERACHHAKFIGLAKDLFFSEECTATECLDD